MESVVWKVTSRRGVAFVVGREAAERVLAAVGRAVVVGGKKVRDADRPLLGAMAVYLDRKGKPFAWLVPFDWADCERVSAAAGVQ